MCHIGSVVLASAFEQFTKVKIQSNLCKRETCPRVEVKLQMCNRAKTSEIQTQNLQLEGGSGVKSTYHFTYNSRAMPSAGLHRCLHSWAHYHIQTHIYTKNLKKNLKKEESEFKASNEPSLVRKIR